MTVLVIGDTHCPGMRRGYVTFLQRIADKYAVNRVVHIGDLVDWHAISYHETHPSAHSPGTEFRLALRQVRSLSKAFPDADWLIGNHDCLTERQARSAGLPTEVLRGYNDLWELDWKVWPRFSKLKIQGSIYTHGDSGAGGRDAALNQARENFCNTILGHFHAQAGVKWWANNEYRVFGAATGCGIDVDKLAFEYGRRFTAKPILGCVVVDGSCAYFEPWQLPTK